MCVSTPQKNRAGQKAAHVLLVEDTPSLAELYAAYLEEECGHSVDRAATGRDALECAERQLPDIVLLDLRLPDMHGLELLDRLRQKNVTAPVIIITGDGSISVAVEAMRRGARDFLIKPFDIEQLGVRIARELESNTKSVIQPRQTATPEQFFDYRTFGGFGGFIGNSAVMQGLYAQIHRAAASGAAVFITGESGTGKEVCAEAIHKYSPRAGRPFIPINCAAIPRDLMESELFGHVKGAFTGAISNREGAARLADGGTLFLDEIAEMNPDMQTKLLRFVQDLSFMKVGGSVMEKTDVRIICATNRNPEAEIRAGNFREDLFYRLHVLPLHMPPLRERGDDVIAIARALLGKYAAMEKKHFSGFDRDAEAVLRACRWPGNIRQLQNAIRQAVVMQDGETVTAAMLPATLTANRLAEATLPASEAANSEISPLAEVERAAVERAIRLCGGNVPEAAARLGVSPSTLYRKKALWDADSTAGTT